MLRLQIVWKAPVLAAVLVIFGWIGLSASCAALSIPPGYNFIVQPSTIGLEGAAYNADTDTLTAEEFGFSIFRHPTDLLPFDEFAGIWNTTAIVDSSGTTSGGAFSWVANSSAALGISSPTLLMAGPVRSVIWEAGAGLEFFSNVDYLAPQLAALWGPIASIELIVFVDQTDFPFWSDTPCPVCTMPWQTTTTFHRYTGDGIWGSPRRIPEPGPLLLIVLAFAGLSLTRLRRFSFSHAARSVTA